MHLLPNWAWLAMIAALLAVQICALAWQLF
jgi:hypothetical protein